jgi:peptide/nickel transport system permease protein
VRNLSKSFIREVEKIIKYLSKDLLTFFSFIFSVMIILMALLPQYISPYDPYKIDPYATFKPPSLEHLFGTDDLGRDILSQVIYGARTSMTIGASAASLSILIGTLLGLLAGFYGGRIDLAISMIIDAKLSIPTFFLILVVIAIFGGSMINMIIVIGITIWPPIARVVRAMTHSIRAMDFVEAAKALGASATWIIFRHILPQTIGVVLSLGILQMGSAIIIEAGLSFLGLGDPTLISWGKMLSIAQTYISRAWWMGFFPGLFLFLTILSFNILGDKLYEYYNPKLREKVVYI